MRALDCDAVRDLLPEWAAGGMAAPSAARVAAHIGGCQACAAEAELVRALRRHRIAAPPDLRRAVLDAAQRPPARSARRVAPALAAAATVALALLTGRGLPRDDGDAPRAAVEDADVLGLDPFLPFSGGRATDGLLAGALMVDALTDEELELLLEEMGT